MSLATALRAFRLVYVAFIVYLSAKTLLAAVAAAHAGHVAHLGVEHAPSANFLMVLAGAEIAAALLFLWQRVEIAAGAVLITVYAVAAAVDMSLGQISPHLAFYAAVALYIVYASGRFRAESGPKPA